MHQNLSYKNGVGNKLPLQMTKLSTQSLKDIAPYDQLKKTAGFLF
jgi:hypothetical protein